MSAAEISPADAVALLARDVVPLEQTERVALAAAAGRVLADDVASVVDAPAFDNAAMDGYALRAADTAPAMALRETGRALAGHPYAGTLGAGEAVRIMTGAALPDGADAVVMLEDVQVNAGRVSLARAVEPGVNVRTCGEHLQSGRVVLARGRRLRSHDAGLLALAGANTVSVVRRLRVGVLSTGDELRDPPAPLGAGGQYDGNRPFILASLAAAGHEAHDLGIVADSAVALAAALQRAGLLGLDAVVSSGGVAQGDADVVRALPGLRFVPLALRPGRGIASGLIAAEGRHLAFYGLPGNSVAAYVMLQFVVLPLLALQSGGPAEGPLTVPLPLAVEARTRPGRIDWRRARFIRRYGALAVEPLPQQGSSMLRTLSDADALAAIGPQPVVAAGESVDVVPLAALP
jgi:molybdopterin molybdotransferase